MFCQHCGTQLEDGLSFCTNCGTKIQYSNVSTNAVLSPLNEQYAQQNSQYKQPNYSQDFAQNNAYGSTAFKSESPRNVSFGEAIKLFFVNYVNFTGRSTKSEYWWAFLFNFLVGLCTAWIPVVGQLISLGFILPGIALCVRRLHDTGKSWVYIFMGFIPIAGIIILIVQLCKDSDVVNQWGIPAAN